MQFVYRIQMSAPPGWRDAAEVGRQFGKRHDTEPVQPLICVAFEQGEDAERREYFLSLDEARRLAQAITDAVEYRRP